MSFDSEKDCFLYDWDSSSWVQKTSLFVAATLILYNDWNAQVLITSLFFTITYRFGLFAIISFWEREACILPWSFIHLITNASRNFIEPFPKKVTNPIC